eukprot:CAMPEP_0118930938 /NCGR_PEP_ID=MMETSP1169-20130426/7454_1 /TAXON_ID=36882 /ORGANISM="Pyramimonas obovata, Strain CCMP722" /LENGTH=102 /DNA_ID=CAMNT_0006873371 /DNA_START=282 /DNA_END=591 /DNA_ORIENTATION=-
MSDPTAGVRRQPCQQWPTRGPSSAAPLRPITDLYKLCSMTHADLDNAWRGQYVGLVSLNPPQDHRSDVDDNVACLGKPAAALRPMTDAAVARTLGAAQSGQK